MNTANRTIDHKRSIISLWSLLACFIVMAASVVLTAPGVYAAPGGGGGKSPGPFVKLSGTVTNSYSGLGIADATVTLTVGNNVIRTLVTDANGEYEDNKAPIGSFTMTTSKANYPDVVEQVYLTKGRVTHNVSMTPNARVIVSATLSGNMMPGDTPTATGSYIILDGSSVVGTNWSQTEGVTAAIGDVAALSTAVTLGSATEYAAHLIDILESPPISAADLPPDLVLQPINQIRKGLQDRYQVVGIYPHAHEEAAAVHLEFAVTTSSGTYTASLNATTDLPWPVSTGVRTV
ncbi:MAG TPA: carboxypeptidase-like regulatory domain-containing protein, partial [Gammaproteobacteria bacterium]|nr:carboxypeptidase-like regulatory domain-containing protein [Gammaproteobacteria bacterium]